MTNHTNGLTFLKSLTLDSSLKNPDSCCKKSVGARSDAAKTEQKSDETTERFGGAYGREADILGTATILRPPLDTKNGRNSASEHNKNNNLKTRGALADSGRKQPKNELICIESGQVLNVGEKSIREKIIESRRLSFNRLDTASRILKNFYNGETNSKGFPKQHKTCQCNKLSTGVDGGVSVVHNPNLKKAKIAGVIQCAMGWSCPVCSPLISNRRADHLRQALNAALDKGLNVSLFTFTIPHHGEIPTELIPKLFLAHSDFWRGKWSDNFRKFFGLVGHVRSFECTFGMNGAHPHIHLLVITEKPITGTKTKKDKYGHREVLPPSKQSAHWNSVFNQWRTVCARHGFKLPSKNGVDIQDGQGAAEYITKMGTEGISVKTKEGESVRWDMADEVTKGVHKKGKTKTSLTPFQLLDEADNMENSEADRRKYRRLYHNYVRATFGRSQVRFSRGLAEKLGISKEMTDEQIVQTELERMLLAGHVDKKEWFEIIRRRSRAVLKEVVEEGGREALAAFLFNLNANKDKELDEFLSEFDARDERTNGATESDFAQMAVEGKRAKRVGDYYRESVIAPDLNKTYDSSEVNLHRYQIRGGDVKYLTHDHIDVLEKVDIQAALEKAYADILSQ